MVKFSRIFPIVLRSLLVFTTPAPAEEKAPCRYLGSYRFRYSIEDKTNPANNMLWVEDVTGFRLTNFRGADCAQLALISDRVFWIKYPEHEISSFDLKTRFTEYFTEGSQFSISPDGERMVVEKESSLAYFNLKNKNETEFFQFIRNEFNQSRMAVFVYGWSKDAKYFWFALNGRDEKPLDLWLLSHKGDLILTKIRPDPLEEAVFNLESGWITQNNGTQLFLMDLVSEKKIVIDQFPVGEKLKPHWSAGGNLTYERGGKSITLTKAELLSRLEATSASSSMVAKREFVPISW